MSAGRELVDRARWHAHSVSVLEILDDRLLDLVDENAECVQLADGLLWSEGPIWVATGGYLLFSDIRNNRRCRWDERQGFSVVTEPTEKANGMTLDAEGRLIVCEHVTHSLVRMDTDGTGADRRCSPPATGDSS